MEKTPPPGGQAVAILGAGNMGTALAQVIAANGHRVHLWSIELDVLEEIRHHRRNSKYLPGIELEAGIEAKWGMAEALAGAWLAVLTVPSQVVRTLAHEAAPHLTRAQAVLNVAKGLEEGSHLRMSQVLAQELPHHLHQQIATMGGPAIAGEFARGIPTAVVVAAPDVGLAEAIRAALENDFFKVETTSDLCGVELGATLKNVYAIALGMCDGLGYGTNTKSFLLTVALAEMAGIGQALGGQPQTLYGLAGLGDLITTGFNPRSRNRTLGEKLVTDANWRHFLEAHTVEGVPACHALPELLGSRELATPLLDIIYSVLFEDGPPAETLQRFLGEFSFPG